ncbi:Mrp/NBP35 family ATP-binding protein [Fonticella tunisiensis]|uniref:Iron-sulfur cluster carrier protein n=1 Tax=Fonticella tunisiensis TaxID=1096341 RepID=A0A4R7KAV4_9CLOT|nr:Mrp/NBP35 family ATP-binding protein [Fonticella tunisiensis]TDT50544.1 Mrp family chromosome partitioning ATPase [Fonticella tunisiensis]
MSNCQSCPSNGNCSRQNNNQQNTCGVVNNPKNRVKHIIGIMSGKGGVGKSTVTAILAVELKRRGFKVGIMDADITGPSIPRLFGINNQRATGDGTYIYPVKTSEGIDVMSMNLLMPQETQPVLWRGPMIGGAVQQFWTDVVWGELDFLLVDMPPGTGDVALTVMQSIPVTGLVMVSTPQSMVSMIVAKAVNMADKMGIKVLGVVENMTYITCPDCGKRIDIYGKNASQEAANKVGVKLLGELPMDKDLMELSDEGRVEKFEAFREEFKNISDSILGSINV